MFDSLGVTRRTAMAVLAGSLARAAGKLPANKNVKWALGTNLWNSFPRVPFTDILDVMRDTGFIGARITQFQRPGADRGAPDRDAGQRQESDDLPQGVRRGTAGGFLAVTRPAGATEEAFKTMCEGFNAIGEIDFPGCHRVLKSANFKSWLCVDLDIARNGPRASYERCGAYVASKLEPIYT